MRLTKRKERCVKQCHRARVNLQERKRKPFQDPSQASQKSRAMDWLSSPIIPYTMALLGALFCLWKPTRIAGCWYLSEAAADFFCNGFSSYWAGTDYVRVHYLISVTAVFFITYCQKHDTHPKLPGIFLWMSILGVVNGAVVFFYQKYWNDWGQSFYEQIGIWIGVGYFIIIAALEASLVILGVLHARGLSGGNRNNSAGLDA